MNMFLRGQDNHRIEWGDTLRNPKLLNTKVLFIDAGRAYQDGKNQNFLRPEDISTIAQTFRTRKSVDKYAYLATSDEIKENGCNLNIPRYVDTFEEEEEIDLTEVRRERERLKAELAELEVEMDGYLKELEYGS